MRKTPFFMLLAIGILLVTTYIISYNNQTLGKNEEAITIINTD